MSWSRWTLCCNGFVGWLTLFLTTANEAGNRFPQRNTWRPNRQHSSQSQRERVDSPLSAPFPDTTEKQGGLDKYQTHKHLIHQLKIEKEDSYFFQCHSYQIEKVLFNIVHAMSFTWKLFIWFIILKVFTYLTQYRESYEYEFLFWSRHRVCKLIMLEKHPQNWLLSNWRMPYKSICGEEWGGGVEHIHLPLPAFLLPLPGSLWSHDPSGCTEHMAWACWAWTPLGW